MLFLLPLLAMLATTTPPVSQAIVVGENHGGAGQTALRFAEKDAARTASVLAEIARMPENSIHLLLSPSKKELLAALAQSGAIIANARKKGEQATLLFFYSGHARASGLSLGDEELSLDELRTELQRPSATLTLVFLDACQSGAFSHVKGAAPAADFSYNTAERLNAEGMAVMASSTGSELSQESESIQGSYFTQHLVAALRGAADVDNDGRVTLSEAYNYAYNHTLIDTSRTAVGEQHVTLETDLRGKGDVPITFPSDASAALALPAGVQGRLLIVREPQKIIVAEVYKAEGSPMQLALVPGQYTIVWRANAHIWSCDLRLGDGQSTPIRPETCSAVDSEATRAKSPQRTPRWGIELAGGIADDAIDNYEHRLEDFGFGHQPARGVAEGEVLLAYAVLPNLSVVARARLLDSGSYDRVTSTNAPSDHFGWTSYALGGGIRARLPFLGARLNPFLQLTGGGGFSVSAFLIDGSRHHEYLGGPLIGGAAGIEILTGLHFGFVIEAGYDYAPLLHNLVGDSHNNGGPFLFVGLHFWK